MFLTLGNQVVNFAHVVRLSWTESQGALIETADKTITWVCSRQEFDELLQRLKPPIQVMALTGAVLQLLEHVGDRLGEVCDHAAQSRKPKGAK